MPDPPVQVCLCGHGLDRHPRGWGGSDCWAQNGDVMCICLVFQPEETEDQLSDA